MTTPLLKQPDETLADVSNPSSLLSREWWQNFAPSLSVATPHLANTKLSDIDAQSTSFIQQLIRQEGYLQASVKQWNVPLPEMALSIKRMQAAGLLPVFAFMYDEFWLLAHQLRHVIGALLGGSYYMLPDFWAWHVDPKQSERGWKPHRDKGHSSLLPDGSPKSVTLWIPLTPATPLNGCMYIVPADRDPTYGTERENEWQFQHQDVRALPAQPGDFFIWNQAVLHWGARASPRGEAPRISVAFEFQRADVPPMNNPLIEAGGLLSFEDRVRLVGKQILQYRHMLSLSENLVKIAEAMATLSPYPAPE